MNIFRRDEFHRLDDGRAWHCRIEQCAARGHHRVPSVRLLFEDRVSTQKQRPWRVMRGSLHNCRISRTASSTFGERPAGLKKVPKRAPAFALMGKA
jgi:hypothetical protein